MQPCKLFDAQRRCMQIIWAGEPMPIRELVAQCDRQLGWKRTTTYTVLKKLCEKGVARREGSMVVSLVSYENVLHYESKSVVDTHFEGSLPSFVAAFMDGRTLSDQEAQALQKLIDAHRKGQS